MTSEQNPLSIFESLSHGFPKGDENAASDVSIRRHDLVAAGLRIVLLSLPVLISLDLFHALVLSSSELKVLVMFALVLLLILVLVTLEFQTRQLHQQPAVDDETWSIAAAVGWALAGCIARSQLANTRGLSWGIAFCGPQLAITLLRLPCRTTHAALFAHLGADTAVSLATSALSAPEGIVTVCVNIMANCVFLCMCLFESHSFEVATRNLEGSGTAGTPEGGEEPIELIERLLVESCDCVVYTDASVTMNVVRGSSKLEELFGDNVVGQPLLCRANGVKESWRLVSYVRDIVGQVNGRRTPFMLTDASSEFSFQHSNGMSFKTELLAVWFPAKGTKEACLAIGFRQLKGALPFATQPNSSGRTAPDHRVPRSMEPTQEPSATTNGRAPPSSVKSKLDGSVMADSSPTASEVRPPSDPGYRPSSDVGRLPGNKTINRPGSDAGNKERSREVSPPTVPDEPAVSQSKTQSHEQTAESQRSSAMPAEGNPSNITKAVAEPVPPAPAALSASLADVVEKRQVVQQGAEQPNSENAAQLFCQPVGTQPTPSVGSRGHPHTCAPACKFVNGAKGCKDGDQCLRCHICKWKKTRAKADKKEENGPAELDLPMTVSLRPPHHTKAVEQYTSAMGHPQQRPPAEFYNRTGGVDPGIIGAQNMPQRPFGRDTDILEARNDTEAEPPLSRINGLSASGGGGAIGVRAGNLGGPAYITSMTLGNNPDTGSERASEDFDAALQRIYNLGSLNDTRIKKKNTFLHCDTSSVLSTKNRMGVSSLSDPGVSPL